MDRFEAAFNYPGSKFSAPVPSATWDASSIYDYDWPEFVEIVEDLNAVSLAAFRQLLDNNEHLYVLDWNHECYSLRPNDKLATGERSLWPVSVFPNGDYHIFISTDFRMGIVSDPDGSICAFGKGFLDLLVTEPPKAFFTMIERNGISLKT